MAKWIREAFTHTTYYYDIWHVAKSVRKKLLAASKEKGCEVIVQWMKGIYRYLYWSATSTKPGLIVVVVIITIIIIELIICCNFHLAFFPSLPIFIGEKKLHQFPKPQINK